MPCNFDLKWIGQEIIYKCIFIHVYLKRDDYLKVFNIIMAAAH